jgi:hypothetical protein
MSSRKRDCPKCGSEMVFRLGEMECPECGHHEPAEPPRPRQEARQPLLPPPPRPPESTPTIFGQIYSPHEYMRKERTASPFLGEKLVMMGIYVAGFLITVAILVLSRGIWTAVGDVGLTYASLVGAVIVFQLLWLALLAWVLFGRFIPVKWGCITLTVLSALVEVGNFIFSGASFSTEPSSWVGGAIGVAMTVWLISLLLRDIDAQQGM